MKQACVIGTLLLLAVSSRAHAEDFYVDPESGSMANDGSASAPWSTLEDVVGSGAFGAEIGAGDVVHLRSGDHGVFALDSGDYDPAITITAEAGHTPALARVEIRASGIMLSNASISSSHAASYEQTTMVQVLGDRVTVEGCDVFSEADVSAWGADEWINRASSGFQVRGDDDVVRNNTVRNVRFGISVDGERALIDGNTIDGFSADGLRGLGNHGVFQYNVVKNVYVDGDLDDNHDDGFQSWSVGDDGVGTGEVVGVVLRGNVIINYEDPAQPLRATLQGIGCFDGTFVDWVIENNVVITDHWHGITLLGARGSRIVNNTVIDVNDETPGPPWISIDDHKDGTPPEDCIVRNNLATDFANADSVTEDNNMVIDDAAALFVDVAAHDLRLRDDAAAIDQGSDELAPDTDAEGIARPQGSGIDLGAYEWHEADVMPIDAGPPVMSTGGAMATGGGAGSTTAGTSATTGGAGGNGGSGGSGTEVGASGSGASGGAAGAQGAPTVDGGTNDTSSDEADEGCGCSVPGHRRHTPNWMWALGLPWVAARLGRRARR